MHSSEHEMPEVFASGYPQVARRHERTSFEHAERAKERQMKARIRKGKVVVELPLINPVKESKTGKTLLVASSGGPRRTALRLNGKTVVVICFAYVRPDGYVKKTKRTRGSGSIRRKPKNTH